jgi:hypothetical protein
VSSVFSFSFKPGLDTSSFASSGFERNQSSCELYLVSLRCIRLFQQGASTLKPLLEFLLGRLYCSKLEPSRPNSYHQPAPTCTTKGKLSGSSVICFTTVDKHKQGKLSGSDLCSTTVGKPKRGYRSSPIGSSTCRCTAKLAPSSPASAPPPAPAELTT